MTKTAGFKDIYGNDVLTYEYIQQLRAEDKEVKKKNFMAAQIGGQEHILSSHADISIVGGSRGGSKSFSILLEGIKDIKNPNFSAVILRHEKPDLENIIEDSKKVFKDYGTYISSDKSMYWDLNSGGRIRFTFHAGDYDDFKVRFQGKQYAYIAIDEITHIDWKKFLYLSTCLRNAHGIRNRIVGSCNPDAESWVAEFIAWWIGFPDTVYSDGLMHPERDGLPIPERDGKIRYCCMLGAEAISDIVWGNSREEVYELCKDKIDEVWTPDMEQFGDPKDLFILSVSFVEAKLTDNKKLLESDPAYLARLANQDEEQIQRDLRGNWHFKSKGNDYLTIEMMEQFFKREPQWGDHIHRAAADIALQGGDNNWTWHIVGNHIADVDVCQIDAKDLVSHTKSLLSDWGVMEENFTFDSNGVGQMLKGFFRRSVPFNNLEAPYGRTEKDQQAAKKDYDTLKSQCVFNLADAIKYGDLSISKELLERRFSGKGFENKPLKDILMEERRVIKVDSRKADAGRGRCIIQKNDMKRIIHRSPDCMESLAYSRIFWVKQPHSPIVKAVGAARFTNSQGQSATRSPGVARHALRYGARPRVRFM